MAINDNTTGSDVNSSRIASSLNVIAGLWLIISPFVLGYTDMTTALWNSIILGVLVAVLAGIRAAYPTENVGLSWINLLFGLWLIISPFVLRFDNPRPTWNEVILGIIVGILAVWSAMAMMPTMIPRITS